MMKTMKDKNTSMTIFDHLKNLHTTKKGWDDMTDLDKKSFSTFMINRFLSMNPDYIEFVNIFQRYTIGILEPREVFKLYSGLLSGTFGHHKYIKDTTIHKQSDELLTYLSTYFEVGKEEIKDYLSICYKTDAGIEYIIDILQKYGLEEKKIKKMLS